MIDVAEVMSLAEQYVRQSQNNTGGSLHIVLEDLNIDDEDVEWCITHAEDREDPEGVTLGLLLRALSVPQRLHIAKHCWDWEE